MKKKLRFAVAALLVLACVFACTALTFANDTSGGDAGVMLNGQYLTFAADSLPQNVGGRIMVPYRAIFESLGASVDYDADTKTITGSYDGVSLSMKNGDCDIHVTYADGTTETKTVDVAPFISNGRTFVPTRFISEILGYTVGWDSENKTVIIIDTASLTTTANDDFSLMAGVQELGGSADETYELNGSLKFSAYIKDGMDFTGLDSSNETTIDVEGTLEGYICGADLDADMDISMDINDEKQDLRLDTKLDSDSGDFYMKGDGITEQNQWMKFNLYKLASTVGVDFASLLDIADSPAYMQDLLSETFATSVEDYDVDTYDELGLAYNLLEAMVGDKAFTKSGNTYTSTFNKESVAAAISAEKNISMGESLGLLKLDDADFSGNMTIETDDNGTVTSSYVTVDIYSAASGLTIKVEARSEELSQEVAMSVAYGSDVQAAFAMGIELAETDSTVDTSIPAGEAVVDVNDLIELLMSTEMQAA